jgi:PAS domain S-box-containing protein
MRLDNLKVLIPVLWLLCLCLGALSPPLASAGQDRVLVFRGDDSYPPYEYLDESGNPAGFNIDITRAVAKVMGLEIKIDLGPWSEVRADLEQGRIDAITGMYFSPERDRLVDFSAPHIINSYALFVRKNSSIGSLEQAGNKKIIVQQGDMGDDYLTAQRLSSQVIRAANPEEGLRLLASGKGDCALLPRLLGLFLAHRLGLKEIKTAGPPLLPQKYCFAVREGQVELVALLNEGLGIIKRTGDYERIYQKWFGAYEKRSILPRVLKYLAFILVPLLVVLALILGWSWSLKRTVAARTRELTAELAERRRAEQALVESEERYRTAIESSIDGVALVQGDKHVFVNKRFAEIYGYGSPGEMKGLPISALVHPDDLERVTGFARKRQSGQTAPSRYEHLGLTKDGRIINIEVSASKTTYQGREVSLSYIRDLTEDKEKEREREELQTRLRQAQKMESLGTLAGGIAHDFNNILSAIFGYTELAMDEARTGVSSSATLKEVLKAAQRAKDLVKRILTFSRRVESEFKPTALNREVVQIKSMLERILPRMINIETRLAEDLWLIQGDPVQLGQVLVNLGTNAGEAMPEGGGLVIETGNFTLDPDVGPPIPGLTPGEYVYLKVADTGVGMDQTTLDQIYDPFFTKKEVGRGTGLGLAVVYGVVKSHGGQIACSSRPGRGTTFTIFLPALRKASIPRAKGLPSSAEPDLPRGSETILLVDDEAALRDLGRILLTRQGYQVLTAGSGEEALEIYRSREMEIDLVILDISMPGMGGHKCLAELIELDPRAKVIISSGYSRNGRLKDVLSQGASGVVDKPFSLGEMVRAVREVLDRK